MGVVVAPDDVPTDHADPLGAQAAVLQAPGRSRCPGVPVKPGTLTPSSPALLRRVSDRGISAPRRLRIVTTVLSDRPVLAATARSDVSGSIVRMRRAAAFRSRRDKGRPAPRSSRASAIKTAQPAHDSLGVFMPSPARPGDRHMTDEVAGFMVAWQEILPLVLGRLCQIHILTDRIYFQSCRRTYCIRARDDVSCPA
jgi:hypothetical protein